MGSDVEALGTVRDAVVVRLRYSSNSAFGSPPSSLSAWDISSEQKYASVGPSICSLRKPSAYSVRSSRRYAQARSAKKSSSLAYASAL